MKKMILLGGAAGWLFASFAAHVAANRQHPVTQPLRLDEVQTVEDIKQIDPSLRAKAAHILAKRQLQSASNPTANPSAENPETTIQPTVSPSAPVAATAGQAKLQTPPGYVIKHNPDEYFYESEQERLIAERILSDVRDSGGF